MKWIVTYKTRNDSGEFCFSSFEEANVVYRKTINEHIDLDLITETFNDWGSDSEESIEIYSSIVECLAKFVTDSKFQLRVDSFHEYYNDEFYSIKTGESFFQVGNPDETGEYALFDDEGNIIPEPVIGPYLTISWKAVNEQEYEYAFELTLYQDICNFSLKRQIDI